MNPFKKQAIWAMLIMLFVFSEAGAGAAALNQNWFEYGCGSAHVLVQAVEGEATTLLLDGELKFEYPTGFQIHYFTSAALIVITSQEDFAEVRTGEELQYGYDRFWLFGDLQSYLFRLAEFSRLPLEFSGVDMIADRPVGRYLTVGEPELTLWFDQQTGIPFLIQQGGESLVKVSTYTQSPHQTEQILSVDIELFFADDQAVLTLAQEENHWAPRRLLIRETHREIIIDFSDWQFTAEWPDSPMPRLTQLRELNERYVGQFKAQDWAEALQTSQEMLALAPQFWQAYLFQAFAYEGLENFLGVVENYQQVLMREPDHHLALNNLAYHYFLREVQISQALEMAERAVELDRKDVYLDTLGYGYYLVGRYEEARQLFEEALLTAQGKAEDEIGAHLLLVLEALGNGE